MRQARRRARVISTRRWASSAVTLSVTQPPATAPYARTDYVSVGCVVPVFANTSTANATATWTGAGFTGNLTFQPVGGKPNTKSSSPPGLPKNIVQQEGLNGGVYVSPSRQNKNSPWECAGDINLRYTP